MARTGTYVIRQAPLHEQISYRFRILRVLSRTEFKLKYAGAVLGYVWSLAKPMLYFAVLWVVFAHLFRQNVPHFPAYLLIGIVLYTFLADTVALTLPSIVARGVVLRRISFPSLMIPVASSITCVMTFLLNCVAVLVFIVASGIDPSLHWVLLAPLLVEYYVFVLGLALILSSLYVRFRDVSQIWEVLASVLLFTSAIMYPIGILPGWAQKVVSFNPLVQVIQDARRVIFTGYPSVDSIVTTSQSRVFPILIAFATLLVGIWLHRRESPRFAEVA
jgi:ABC-2 type transport system permease protein